MKTLKNLIVQEFLLITIFLSFCTSVKSSGETEQLQEQPDLSRFVPGASGYGDLRFTGFDGVNFNFAGQPGDTYCMISDTWLHVNMKLGGYAKLTWIESIGLMYRGHRIVLEPSNGAVKITADGVDASSVLTSQGSVYRNGAVSLTKEGANVYRIVAGKLALRMKADNHGHFHIVLDVLSGAYEELTGAVHGVLGQTLLNALGRFRLRGNVGYGRPQTDGPVVDGDGYLDGTDGPADYATTGILYSDCRFSRFNPNFVDDYSIPALPIASVSSGYSRMPLIG